MKLKIKNFCFLAITLLVVLFICAGWSKAASTVDSTFNAQIQTSRFNPKSVTQLLRLPDGKILALGGFNDYNGTSVGSLIRLNADASLDNSFNNNLLKAGPERAILQPNGKILLSGSMTLANGNSYPHTVIRLNYDGTFDNSFVFPPGSQTIWGVVPDSSNRILVSGFIRVIENGAIVDKQLIRLNEDGTEDMSFNALPKPCFGVAGGSVSGAVSIQNNKILYPCNENNQTRIFRLNENGTNDTSFTPTAVADFQFVGMSVQADNKILVLTPTEFLRLNENGGVDPDFQLTIPIPTGQVRSMFLQSDGKIMFAYTSNSPSVMNFVRLLSNGSADPSFTSYFYQIYQNNSSTAYTVQFDGSVLLSNEWNNSSSNNFTRLLPNGSVDVSFNIGKSGFQNIDPGKIRTIKILDGGKVLIGGDFTKVNSIIRNGVALLNSDGTLDNSFQINFSGTGNYFSNLNDIYKLSVQNDGKILVSGNFSYFVNNNLKRNLVRLNTDGSIDATFNLSVGFNDLYVTSNLGTNKSIQRSDGKIFVGTSRSSMQDQTAVPTVLTAEGSKDTSFNSSIFNTKDAVIIFDLALQPDGKILIAGKHIAGNIYESIVKGYIVRLNSDGTIDQNFHILETADRNIFALSLLPNGKIIAAAQTQLQSSVFRLNSDGSNDNSFNSSTGANGNINALAVLPNDKILVGGLFSIFNNQPRRNLALLNADGTLNEDSGSPNDEILCITVDSQGRVLIGGQFTSISNGGQNLTANNVNEPMISRSYLARLIFSSISPVERTQFDFDGDGKSDVSVFRPNNGAWYLQQSQAGFTGITFGFGTDKLVPADYDGDGKTDVTVYRNGTWYLQRSSLGFTGVTFGDANDIPVPADYDGDGKADIAVFRPSNGTWYVQGSTVGFYGVQFGQTGDKPVASDYDGDGKADIAVNRNGTWYIQRSQLGFYGIQFGDSNDKLVPADYDGDGKADVAVFRPSNGTWYLQQSTAGFTGIAFGLGTDIPVAADYDGDGKVDVAVVRNGNWYLNRSTAGFTGIQFGTSTDLPIPNTFVR